MAQNNNKICVIGTGYVGLVAGACFADMGNKVICVDNNIEKINNLNKLIMPIFEPGLEEIVKSNFKEHRLTFSSDIDFAVKNSNICFIAVGTPSLENGSADLSYVYEVAKSVAKSMNDYKIIVNKSTVPVGTADKIADIIKQNSNFDFDIVYNPEFLKQGNAVEDFLSPDRIIIGTNSEKAANVMKELYAPFFRLGNRILVMDIKSAEITKYAANSFLATKISFINEIANLCDKVGADAQMVRIGISSDSRIGNKFLYPGIGFGGSCFPKDVRALIDTGNKFGLNMSIAKAAYQVNLNQCNIFLDKIYSEFGTDLTDKYFAVWGLAFKPKTNDMREAPSVNIIKELLKHKARVIAYDPKAIETAKKYFNDSVIYSDNAYDTLNNADALLLLTEWNEFRRPDFEIIKSRLKSPIIFDGRNQYVAKLLSDLGFKYYSFGNNN